MYAGANRDEWTRLSVLLAHLANINRDPKSDLLKPEVFDIYDKHGELKKPEQVIKPTLKQVLRQAFPNGEKRK